MNRGVSVIGRKFREALAIDGWKGPWLRLRDFLRRRRLGSTPLSRQYAIWRDRIAARRPEADRAGGATLPTIGIVLFGNAESEEPATRESLEAGTYPGWRIHAASRSAPIPDDSEIDAWIAVDAGDRIHSRGLERLVQAWIETDDRDGTIVYADEDVRTSGDSWEPRFKPGWSPLLSLNRVGEYPGCPTLIPSSLACRVADPPLDPDAPWADLTLRSLGLAARIVHVPEPLVTRVDPPGGGIRSMSPVARRRILEAELARRSIAGAVVDGVRPDTVRVIPGAADAPPTVTVILPTRDQPHYLRAVLSALRALPPDPTRRIILLDHLTEEPEARALLDEASTREDTQVLRFEGPFNFSRMINRGAELATTTHILLLNNDVEPSDPGWLDRLREMAAWRGVGAVGARLAYDDGSCQHAGIALGVGTVAGHLGKGGDERPAFPGLDSETPREVAAGTGACLLVRKEAFDRVGGLDEERLAVSFNDVDLCLKIRREGWSVIYEPSARLVHHETKTRDPRLDPAEVLAMRERWGSFPLDDPYYPLALSRLDEQPGLDLWASGPPPARAYPPGGTFSL